MENLRWILPDPVEPEHARRCAAEWRVPLWVAELLVRRGFADAEVVKGFLQPRLGSLRDPFLLPQMDRAVERILEGLDRKQRIILYGDYDVDGVTSLALMTRVLRAYGGDPECFLPLRMDEGYGLTPDGVARCVETMRPELLIALDCGTSSCAEIAGMCAQGIDVIVVDHHEAKDTPPKCTAIINPKLGDSFHYLCTVGLAFKLAHALLKRRPIPGFDLRECLDLVALGTVADLVPLLEENRPLVKRGLVQLAQTKSVGIRALLEVSGIRPPLSAQHVGFGLGPRLNAAGRLGTAEAALQLLLTKDPERARRLATELDRQNRERRRVEDEVLAEAEKQLAEWYDPARHAGIVLGARGWHPGVVGIVASRIMKRYHRPTFIVGFDENGLGKGSGRSIEGFPLVTALQQCSQYLQRFGGHAMAAGITVFQPRLEEFREAFCGVARSLLSDDQLRPRLMLDAELSLAEVNFDLLEQLEALQPFGIGNFHPTFYARRVTFAAEPHVMKERHLLLPFRDENGQIVRAVWFDGAKHRLPRPPWDVAFEIERNEYQGFITPQMQVKAVRLAS